MDKHFLSFALLYLFPSFIYTLCQDTRESLENEASIIIVSGVGYTICGIILIYPMQPCLHETYATWLGCNTPETEGAAWAPSPISLPPLHQSFQAFLGCLWHTWTFSRSFLCRSLSSLSSRLFRISYVHTSSKTNRRMSWCAHVVMSLTAEFL